MFFLAWKTCSRVAVPFTFMTMAIQYFLTFLTALKSLSFFAAFDSSLWFSTLTSNDSSFKVTGFAFTLMTSFRTSMRTIGSSFFITNGSTTMWWQIPVLLRIKMFSAIAIIPRHWLIIFKIALWAFPIEYISRLSLLLLINIFNPLLNATQMHGDWTAVACPDPISSSNILRTDYTVLLWVTTWTLNKTRSLQIITLSWVWWWIRRFLHIFFIFRFEILCWGILRRIFGSWLFSLAVLVSVGLLLVLDFLVGD